MQNLIIDIKTSDRILTNQYLGDQLLIDLVDVNDYSIVGFSSHVFDNDAYTLAYLLAESHITMHTWKDEHYISIEIFGCNGVNLKESLASIKKFMKVDKLTYQLIERKM